MNKNSVCCEVGFQSADFCHTALIVQLATVRCGFSILTVCNCGNCVREVNQKMKTRSKTFVVCVVLIFWFCNQNWLPNVSYIWKQHPFIRSFCRRQLVVFVVLITSAVSKQTFQELIEGDFKFVLA